MDSVFASPHVYERLSLTNNDVHYVIGMFVDQYQKAHPKKSITPLIKAVAKEMDEDKNYRSFHTLHSPTVAYFVAEHFMNDMIGINRRVKKSGLKIIDRMQGMNEEVVKLLTDVYVKEPTLIDWPKRPDYDPDHIVLQKEDPHIKEKRILQGKTYLAELKDYLEHPPHFMDNFFSMIGFKAKPKSEHLIP